MSQDHKNSNQIHIKDIKDLGISNDDRPNDSKIVIVKENKTDTDSQNVNENEYEEYDEKEGIRMGGITSTLNRRKPINKDQENKHTVQSNILSIKRVKKPELNIDSIENVSKSNGELKNIGTHKNITNGIHLLSVTDDYSKDYSSCEESNTDDKRTSKTNSICDPNLMITPLDSNEDKIKKDGEDEDLVDLSIYELLERSSKKFILKPATMGLNIRCQIFRQKGLFPSYKFYLENLDGKLLLLMTARKRKIPKTTCYIINSITYSATDIDKYVETPIAKLKSNLLGTLFTLYDFGLRPNTVNRNSQKNSKEKDQNTTDHENQNNEDSNLDNDESSLRKEYLSISYELNLFGFKGPRQMLVIIPGMDNEFNREDFFIKNENDSILSAWKKLEDKLKSQSKKDNTPSVQGSNVSQASRSKNELNTSTLEIQENVDINNNNTSNNDNNNLADESKFDDQANVVKLINKAPTWHAQLKSFALNFKGRVTQASVKNYQIIHEVNSDYIVTQFGKVDDELYTCDYSYPMCALQAFGIALTSIHNKLGCD